MTTTAMGTIAPETIVTHGVRMLRWRSSPLPGQVFVFLHGLGDGADVWRPVLSAWPDAPITAVAYDFPGHGGTDWMDPKAYSVPNLTKWLANCLARDGIRNPVLIGHSLGARVALEIATSGYVSPQHVVLVDVNPDPGNDLDNTIKKHLDILAAGAPSLQSFSQRVAARLPLADRDVLESTLEHLAAASGDTSTPGVRLNLDMNIKQLLRAPEEVDGWGSLASMGCAGTIIRGAFSSALDAKTAKKMSQTIQRPSACLSVPKSGHAIAFEQPTALARAIAQGVRGVRA